MEHARDHTAAEMRAWTAFFREVVPCWLAVLAAEVCDLTGREVQDVLEDTHSAAFSIFAAEAIAQGRADAMAALKAMDEGPCEACND